MCNSGGQGHINVYLTQRHSSEFRSTRRCIRTPSPESAVTHLTEEMRLHTYQSILRSCIVELLGPSRRQRRRLQCRQGGALLLLLRAHSPLIPLCHSRHSEYRRLVALQTGGFPEYGKLVLEQRQQNIDARHTCPGAEMLMEGRPIGSFKGAVGAPRFAHKLGNVSPAQDLLEHRV